VKAVPIEQAGNLALIVSNTTPVSNFIRIGQLTRWQLIPPPKFSPKVPGTLL